MARARSYVLVRSLKFLRTNPCACSMTGSETGVPFSMSAIAASAVMPTECPLKNQLPSAPCFALRNSTPFSATLRLRLQWRRGPIHLLESRKHQCKAQERQQAAQFHGVIPVAESGRLGGDGVIMPTRSLVVDSPSHGPDSVPESLGMPSGGPNTWTAPALIRRVQINHPYSWCPYVHFPFARVFRSQPGVASSAGRQHFFTAAGTVLARGVCLDYRR